MASKEVRSPGSGERDSDFRDLVSRGLNGDGCRSPRVLRLKLAWNPAPSILAWIWLPFTRPDTLPEALRLVSVQLPLSLPVSETMLLLTSNR
jgi:hypothetical protein